MIVEERSKEKYQQSPQLKKKIAQDREKWISNVLIFSFIENHV